MWNDKIIIKMEIEKKEWTKSTEREEWLMTVFHKISFNLIKLNLLFADRLKEMLSLLYDRGGIEKKSKEK